MEKIQLALQKAQQEQQDRGNDSPSSQPDTEAAKPAAADVPMDAQLDFSRARKVNANESALLSNRIVVSDYVDERAEVYRHLRTQVLPTLRDNKWHTLGITSAGRNEGKTLTAINLALSIAQEYGQSVLLVDLDIRDPSVSSVLGLEVNLGVSDYLRGNCKLQDVLVDPGLGDVTLLPGRPFERRYDELLTHPSMKQLLTSVCNTDDDRIVIFDLPQLLGHNDSLIFLPNVEAVVLVVEEGGTTADALQKSLGLLQRSNVLGTVLNKSRYSA